MKPSLNAGFVLVGLGLACGKAAPVPDLELADAAGFVRAFYAWYLPAAGTGSGLQRAMADSATLFAPALVQAIEADGEAQAKNPNEVVGLDGDPFLDAQDFCPAYDVGTARREGTLVLVDVRGNCEGQTDSAPHVAAQLSRQGSGWIFTNFRYPRRNSDLLKDLAELKRERERAPAN